MKKHTATIRFAGRFTNVKQGSALLIAILVMGILLTLTMGLSDLVIREIRQTGDAVAAGKAYFAAEAGVENALMDLHENLPGFETENPSDPSDKFVKIQDSLTGLDARYRIVNKADKVPSFDTDKPIFLGANEVPTNVNFVYDFYSEATYKDLALSESVVIPLYSEKDGVPERVDNFLIEYYVNYDTDQLASSGIPQDQFRNLDVLRWKIFGKPDPAQGGDPSKTEAISDFFPATFDSSADTPMCIGTYQALQPTGPGQGCQFPVLSADGVNDDNNLWGAARECYLSDSGIKGQLNDIQTASYGGCTIQSFVQSHIQNYLVLTNVINPDVLMPGQSLNTAEAKKRLMIHYRVVAEPGADKPKLVREAASISADGFALNGLVKQSIDVQINQSSFLPVFNFSLYHTKTN